MKLTPGVAFTIALAAIVFVSATTYAVGTQILEVSPGTPVVEVELSEEVAAPMDPSVQEAPVIAAATVTPIIIVVTATPAPTVRPTFGPPAHIPTIAPTLAPQPVIVAPPVQQPNRPLPTVDLRKIEDCQRAQGQFMQAQADLIFYQQYVASLVSYGQLQVQFAASNAAIACR